MALEKSEAVVRDIKRRIRRKYSVEEKITIVFRGAQANENPASISIRDITLTATDTVLAERASGEGYVVHLTPAF